ncbi:hypothetical protein DSECCO2_545980 [anaerobic digester metagenome]
MKFGRIIGLLVVLFLIVPVASAGSIGSENSGVASNLPQVGEFGTRAYFSISQGELDYHGYFVSPGASSLSVDLNWFSDLYSLRLGIFRPNGSLYGYYYDCDDGDDPDGEFRLTINNPASGSWTFTVYGESVTGTQPYSFNVG